MIYTTMIKKALNVCYSAHKDQVDNCESFTSKLLIPAALKETKPYIPRNVAVEWY